MHLQRIRLKGGCAYRLTWYEGGKRKQKYFPVGTPLHVVKQFQRRIAVDVALAKAGLKEEEEHRRAASMCLAEFAAWYAKERAPEISERTMRTNLYNFQFLVVYCGPDFRLGDLNAEIMEGFKRHEVKRGRSQAWVNKTLVNLRAMFNFAVRRGLLKENPLRGVAPYRTAKKLPEIFTVEEIDRIEQHVEPAVSKLAFQIVKYTGMRRGEVCSITWDDIDLKRRLIRLRETKTRQERYVPIHRKLAEILEAWPDKNGKVIPRHPSTVQHDFRRAIEKAGLGHKRGSVHILRHSLGAYLISQGVNVRVVQELLGHKTLQMTQLYTQVAQEVLQAEIDKLDF